MIPEGCCGCQWLESTKHQLGKLSAESSFPTVDSWRRSYIDGFLPDLHSMVQMEGVCVQAIWWLKECVYKLFGYWRSVCTSNLVVGRYVCVCVQVTWLLEILVCCRRISIFFHQLNSQGYAPRFWTLCIAGCCLSSVQWELQKTMSAAIICLRLCLHRV